MSTLNKRGEPGIFLFCYLEKEVKLKIQNFRTYYGKELNKEKTTRKSGASASEVYESKWPYFKSLDFLRDTIAPRKTNSNLVSKLRIIYNCFAMILVRNC